MDSIPGKCEALGLVVFSNIIYYSFIIRAQNNGRQSAVFSTNATNSRAKFALICNYCQAFEYNSMSCDKCVQLELLRINIGTRRELQEQA